MIVVTGGAGFIGSGVVRALNARGVTDILVVDDLSDGTKCANLADCDIADYVDKDDFVAAMARDQALPPKPRAVFHQGACCDTMEWDGRFVMRNNYAYSKTLLHHCVERRVPFIYASSASVYGPGPVFAEQREHERPLNMYAYSKFLLDAYVRALLPRARSQVAGLRYFNVYGPGEQHKGAMASVAWHFHQQVLADGEARVFEGSDGYEDGEQRRDFVYVGDVAAVNLWLLDNPGVSGIFNVGTGRSQTFNDVARAVIGWHGRGRIRYIPFPPALAGHYQSYTEADIGRLRAAGYDAPFKTVEQGVEAYLGDLAQR